MEPGHPTSLTFDHLEVQQTAQQVDERRRELERMLDEIKKQLAQLEMKRAEAEFAKNADVHRKMVEAAAADFEKVQRTSHELMANAAHAQHAASEAEMAAARRQYEEARQLFEKGLTSRSQLVEAEAALARMQAKGDADATAAVELQQAMEKLARARQLAEKGLLAQRDLAALEVEVAALEQRLVASQAARANRTRDRQAAAENAVTEARRLHDLRTTAEVAIAAREQERAALAERLRRSVETSDTPQPASEQARAGDTLRITIEGEPDLPSTYRVRDDGTIRLPFVGVLKVAGLTAAQVREAVGKQLSDRKLGSTSQVQVTLARPRARVSRNLTVEIAPDKDTDKVSAEIKRVR
jgi:tetratricopeptide (TPR) repeat protein